MSLLGYRGPYISTGSRDELDLVLGRLSAAKQARIPFDEAWAWATEDLPTTAHKVWSGTKADEGRTWAVAIHAAWAAFRAAYEDRDEYRWARTLLGAFDEEWREQPADQALA